MKQPPRPRVPRQSAGTRATAQTPPSRPADPSGGDGTRTTDEGDVPRAPSGGGSGEHSTVESHVPGTGAGRAGSDRDRGRAGRSGRAGGDSPARGTTGRAVTRRRTPRSLEHPLEAGDAATVLGSHEEAVSTGLGERLEERRRARMRLRGTHVLVLVSALATVAVVAWGIFFSPFLALAADKVSVTGADDDLTGQVTQAVRPFVGTPLPRIDTAAVVEAVDEIPLVRSAEVSRVWPDGLSVVVRARVAALAEKDGDGFALVDDQGVAVSHRGDAPDGMPVVTLPAEGEDRVRAAGAAATTWAALPEDLRPEVEQVRADGHMVTLALSGGRTVRWGTDEDGDLKAKVLALLLDQRPASVYDVSDPTRPVTS